MMSASQAHETASAALDPIAQTNLQLFEQLRRRGHGAEDVDLVRRAYELALTLNACQYRSSGRSLVEHLLGTTSVVASLGANAALVAATMAHAVYVHGDVGTLRKRPGAAQRRRVRDAIGDAAEAIIDRYSVLYWNVKTVGSLRERLPSMDALDRDALTIRLGDQLDIYGTREALYYDNVEKRREFARELGPSIVAMADQLGYPQLGAALRHAYAHVLDTTIPAGLEQPPWRDGIIVPASYRVRPSIALYRGLRSRLWRWTGR